MFSLELAFLNQSRYRLDNDFFVKGFSYALGSVVFLEILRGQVSEVNVLQLVPGFYLFLLFISLLVLVLISTILFQISYRVDIRKSAGTKSPNRYDVKTLIKLGLALVLTLLPIVLNTVIPLGLESFNSYGEKSLENVWSLDQIIALETILLFILLTLSQVPVLSVLDLQNEDNAGFFPRYWRPVSLGIFVFSGVLTPTIDGYTQVSLSVCALSLYTIIIWILQKRVDMKFLPTILVAT